MWIEVQKESWDGVLSLVPECCADAAGTSQVAMTQLRQHLSHDVIWKTLQAASAGQLVKVVGTRRRAQQFAYRPMCLPLEVNCLQVSPSSLCQTAGSQIGEEEEAAAAEEEEEEEEGDNRTHNWVTCG